MEPEGFGDLVNVFGDPHYDSLLQQPGPKKFKLSKIELISSPVDYLR